MYDRTYKLYPIVVAPAEGTFSDNDLEIICDSRDSSDVLFFIFSTFFLVPPGRYFGTTCAGGREN